MALLSGKMIKKSKRTYTEWEYACAYLNSTLSDWALGIRMIVRFILLSSCG